MARCRCQQFQIAFDDIVWDSGVPGAGVQKVAAPSLVKVATLTGSATQTGTSTLAFAAPASGWVDVHYSVNGGDAQTVRLRSEGGSASLPPAGSRRAMWSSTASPPGMRPAGGGRLGAAHGGHALSGCARGGAGATGAFRKSGHEPRPAQTTRRPAAVAYVPAARCSASAPSPRWTASSMPWPPTRGRPPGHPWGRVQLRALHPAPAEGRIPLLDASAVERLAVYIDGADEIDHQGFMVRAAARRSPAIRSWPTLPTASSASPMPPSWCRRSASSPCRSRSSRWQLPSSRGALQRLAAPPLACWRRDRQRRPHPRRDGPVHHRPAGLRAEVSQWPVW